MLSKPEDKENALTHAIAIIRNGLEKRGLRNEIYCQLLKQVNENPKERYALLVWELIAFCTGCFSPDSYMYQHLVKFFEDTMGTQQNEFSAWASFCKDRVEKTYTRGKRLFVPVEKELIHVKVPFF